MELGMNREKIEQLRDQYLHDPSIIFATPSIVQEVPCGTAMCYAGQVCANEGWELKADRSNPAAAWATRGIRKTGALELAGEILDLDWGESNMLFDKDHWPIDLRVKPDTPALAAERLQRFLNSDGRE